MITAMTSFVILLVAIAAIAATVATVLWALRLIASDDRGHRSPPASHLVDQRFLPPAARL